MSYSTLRRDASWAKRAIEVDQYATKQASKQELPQYLSGQYCVVETTTPL